MSTDRCVPCPANSYREGTGATNIANCVSCQPKSSTKTLTGQSTRRACACDVEFYLIITNKGAAGESLSCQACPKGAQCANGECALRNTNLTCSDGKSKVIGEWVIDSATGQYMLTSCPAGYELRTADEQGSADLQQCFKCPSPSTYILRPVLDTCQVCPPGLSCQGDATLTPVVEGSMWERDNDIFRLKTCPSGYYVFPKFSDAFVMANQKCLPCEKGEECTNTSCVT